MISVSADRSCIAVYESAGRIMTVLYERVAALETETAQLTEALRVAEDEAEMLRGLVSALNAGRPSRA